MPVNQELTNAILEVMCSFLNRIDSTFGDSTTDGGLAKLRRKIQLRVDKPHKVRIHYKLLVGYGYDLRKTDEDGTPSREVYHRAVANTKQLAGRIGENLVAEGTIEDKIGWYITRIRLVQHAPPS